MATRKVIKIDEAKCVGCGQCVNHCPGGALAMVDGKAKLVCADFCDSLGVCIGECPVGAISFEDVEVVSAPVKQEKVKSDDTLACGCPGTMNKQLMPAGHNCAKSAGQAPSELGAWPVQLHLIRPEAPQFIGAEILIAASCSAFACGAFHARFLAGKGLIIACPKLDRQEGYREKLAALFSTSAPESITIVRMEVPCCAGLTRLVLDARSEAGSGLSIKEITIGLSGEVIAEKIL